MSSIAETLFHPIKSIQDRQRRIEGQQKRNKLFINLWRLKEDIRGREPKIEIPGKEILPNLPSWIKNFLTDGKDTEPSVEFLIETTYPPQFRTKTEARLRVGSRVVKINACSEGLSNISTAIGIEKEERWGVVKNDRTIPYIPFIDTSNGHPLNSSERTAINEIKKMPQENICQIGSDIVSAIRKALQPKPPPAAC